MSIENYFCMQCKHELVCKIKDKIAAFHEDAKKPLDVDITLDKCKNFDYEK